MTAVGLLAALLYLPSARPQAPQPDGGGREAFKRTQKQQLDHMWDQSQP
jgi:hypothetical protein